MEDDITTAQCLEKMYDISILLKKDNEEKQLNLSRFILCKFPFWRGALQHSTAGEIIPLEVPNIPAFEKVLLKAHNIETHIQMKKWEAKLWDTYVRNVFGQNIDVKQLDNIDIPSEGCELFCMVLLQYDCCNNFHLMNRLKKIAPLIDIPPIMTQILQNEAKYVLYSSINGTSKFKNLNTGSIFRITHPSWIQCEHSIGKNIFLGVIQNPGSYDVHIINKGKLINPKITKINDADTISCSPNEKYIWVQHSTYILIWDLNQKLIITYNAIFSIVQASISADDKELYITEAETDTGFLTAININDKLSNTIMLPFQFEFLLCNDLEHIIISNYNDSTINLIKKIELMQDSYNPILSFKCPQFDVWKLSSDDKILVLLRGEEIYAYCMLTGSLIFVKNIMEPNGIKLLSFTSDNEKIVYMNKENKMFWIPIKI